MSGTGSSLQPNSHIGIRTVACNRIRTLAPIQPVHDSPEAPGLDLRAYEQRGTKEGDSLAGAEVPDLDGGIGAAGGHTHTIWVELDVVN